MLEVYYSNRIETLADDLKRRLVEARAACDPFAFSRIVVPNANIAKWLQMRAFADAPSLSMGLEFPFIEQCLFDLLTDLPGQDRSVKLTPMNAYANAIVSILLNDGDERLAPFRNYLGMGKRGAGSGKREWGSGKREAVMLWQLASKLADLLDQYEVKRPGIIAKWLKDSAGGEAGEGERSDIEIAEAALAQKLFGKGGVYDPDGDTLSLRQLFDRCKARAFKNAHALHGVQSCGTSGAPAKRRIYFFAVSTLAPLQIAIIHLLARHHDITVYHNNVCREYWGDCGAETNPLLKSWGLAGKETIRLLVDLEDAAGGGEAPIEFEWRELESGDAPQNTVLGKVQQAIYEDAPPQEKCAAQDASLQIAGAPGLRREVELVHNAILGAVWKPDGGGARPWGDCSFSDIAVLVPDMKKYRPVIESVFDGRDLVPYGIIDTSASAESCWFQGFKALLSLALEGFSRERLFALFDNRAFQNAAGAGPEEIDEWRRITEECGAFDGFDSCAPGEENFTWGEALKRLRLGRIADETPALAVWQGGGDGALKFSALVELLYRELKPLECARFYCAPGAVPQDEPDKRNWADTLRRIAGEFLSSGRDEPLEQNVCSRLFQSLYALDAVKGRQNLALAAAAAEQFAGGIKSSRGGYLTNGVTIASLQPMRPVPFKQIFVLGMGEGMFPGRDSESTLDIRGANRALGDMLPTEIRKYLFLETVLSARERLVLTYPDKDLRKDAELFPSGIIHELEKFVGEEVLAGDTTFKESRLPLLERGEGACAGEENPAGPVAWGGGFAAGLFATYSNAERRIARRIATQEKHDIAGAQIGAAGDREPESIDPSPRELAAFIKKPLRAALMHRLGIRVEGYRDREIPPDSPLELETNEARWEFERAMLDEIARNHLQREGDPDAALRTANAVYDDFARHGKLPQRNSRLGEFGWSRICEYTAKAYPALRDAIAEFIEGGSGLCDWRSSEDGAETHAMVCRKLEDKAVFAPDATLEPLVKWLAAIAEKPEAPGGENACSLRVTVVDVQNAVSMEWEWRATPSQAREYIEGLRTAYSEYLENPCGDGAYVDTGYVNLCSAILKAKVTLAELRGGESAWGRVIAEYSAGEFAAKTRWNNNLAVEETSVAWKRQSEAGDESLLRETFLRIYGLPLSGRLVLEEVEDANM